MCLPVALVRVSTQKMLLQKMLATQKMLLLAIASRSCYGISSKEALLWKA